MNRVQLYIIAHFGGDIIRPKIRSIISYVGRSTKLTSLRAHSSYEDFVILLEEISEIRHEDWLSTTKDTSSGKGMSTTKVGRPLRHNLFPDPEPEYRGYPKISGRRLDPRRFGPLVDDDDVPQSNNSFKTIRTNVPPLNEPSIPQSNVHHSNEPMLTNVPQSNEPCISQSNIHLSNEPVLTNVPLSNKLMLNNVPLSIKAEHILDKLNLQLNYSLSPARIDSETIESWTYFLEMFGSNFYGYDTKFVVISGRNAKIINVIPKVLPFVMILNFYGYDTKFVIHMFCAFYILNNIKTTLESTRIAIRMAAEALTSIDFDKHMNVIRNTEPVGYQYILGILKEAWSNLYIPMSRYGVAYINHVESWNNIILKMRDLPIHVFIEELRKMYLEMFYTYREEAEKSQTRLIP
ncbi:hypothetical protein GIB67_039694 [Kingdonia uniflora]|uniref:Uncharacterized protein n=1 Tax=Kingdonia uniflora TaxID=39325 RepID=A0A7J7MPX3_9MAGN|nr:hypothetical protein GIB67_039694 [Kingdonia uniflora]